MANAAVAPPCCRLSRAGSPSCAMCPSICPIISSNSLVSWWQPSMAANAENSDASPPVPATDVFTHTRYHTIDNKRPATYHRTGETPDDIPQTEGETRRVAGDTIPNTFGGRYTECNRWQMPQHRRQATDGGRRPTTDDVSQTPQETDGRRLKTHRRRHNTDGGW